ncbi:hypothetical protein A4A49_43243 [Nicotiana attenuata]|uniref:DUF4283 domain-containing protein n=1 Tax=Nicotiana attenuata TaxID=49451 RepID=A0A1J6KA30_NICAT|nr:hypothetical protein A4A49_43243 [Nicotiana attenuata]
MLQQLLLCDQSQAEPPVIKDVLTPNADHTETQHQNPHLLTVGKNLAPSFFSVPTQTNTSNQAPSYDQNHNKPVHNSTLKVSSNFARPNIPRKNQKNHTKHQEKTLQPTQSNPVTTIIPQPNANQNKDKQPVNPPPPSPTVTHSYVTRLRARHEAEREPISFTPPMITTKLGQPAVIFKREDYMVRVEDRCKFTVIGKFSNSMPKMEVIRRSFISQTELKGGIKIAHFNARTMYIDLDNEYDHSTVWAKQYMYI